MRHLLVIIVVTGLVLPVPVCDPSVQFAPVPSDTAHDSEQVYGTDLSYDVYQQIDLDSYRDYIIKLTENGSRWTEFSDSVTFSDANVYARNWIIKTLDEVSQGRIETEILGDHKSVVGILPGWASDDAPVFMVGGHYDSAPGAPGANDDGTGVAAALELARVMSQYSWPLDIYFCFWNSEEIGLLGSREVAGILNDRHLDVLHYFNVDMLLVDDPDGDPDEQVLSVYNNYAPFHESKYYSYLLKALSNNIGINIVDPTPSSRFFGWQRSDHYSFVQEGYSQVSFLFESGFERDDSYHQPTDVWNNPLYNYTVATEAVKCIGASMAFVMAYAPSQLTHMDYEESLEPGQTRAYYIPISAPTNMTVYSNWTGGGLDFSLRSPSNLLIDEAQFSGSNMDSVEALGGSAESLALYKVVVSNPSSTPVVYDISVRYDVDLNGDDILDSKQYWFDPIMFSLDLDGDDLSDGLEKLIGTSRTDSDSDGDAMPDGWEYFHGLDPLTDDALEDPDNDTVLNLFEFGNSTDPQCSDTDQDALPDDWEIEHGLDPLTNDTAEDPDNDGFTNLEEYELDQDPNSPDMTTTTATSSTTEIGMPWGMVVMVAGMAAVVILVGILLLRRRNL
ncbi:Zn-dependent exopeptidase M28 [Candidatus Thorarchaeota archaeon]|nr:MAG: Zn-dependent exopeptidase M28 [Candidatus Thorarchaeota archaeon]